MAQTLAQITKQIEKLQKEADALRKAEVKGVVDRIKVAISHYGLTPDQLGFGKPAVKGAKAASSGTAGNGNAATPRFANGEGQTWAGRGPRPRWLREALANGRSLEEFSTDSRKRSVDAVPASKQGNALATAVPSAKAKGVTKRAKAGTKNARIAGKSVSSSSEGALANANAASVTTPKASRQAKMNSSKQARASKALATAGSPEKAGAAVAAPAEV